MPAKWHKYSYSAQREERRSVFVALFLCFLIGIIFTLVHNNICTMLEVETSLLEPSLSEHDRIIATPLYQGEIRNNRLPFMIPSRGDLALISPMYQHDTPVPLRFLDSIVSFITLQRIHLFVPADTQAHKSLIRRILGFPGDTIYLEKNILHIKPAGTSHFLTEFELSERDYDITINNLPDNWSKDLPFSGDFTEITLNNDEYFVMNDNRLLSGDSRIWGPVPAERIQAKVLFRYWPFDRFGPL